MLFQVANVAKIVAGQKTVTRRRERANGSRPAVPGRIIEARTRLFDPEAVFAFLLVLSVSHEDRPGEALRPHGLPRDFRRRLDHDGVREGYQDWFEFACVYGTMHGEASLRQPCWRVGFRIATLDEIMGANKRSKAVARLKSFAEKDRWPGVKRAVCPWWHGLAVPDAEDEA